MAKLLNSIYLGASTPSDYGNFAGGVELLPYDYYLGAATPSTGPSYIDVLLSGVSPLVLTKALELNYLKLFGGTEQNGTPTPTSPVDIVCNNGILKVSPNLFNKNLVPDVNEYINKTNGNVSSPTSGEFRHSDYIVIKENTQYYVGIITSTANTAGLAFYDDTKTLISGMSLTELGNNNNIVTSPNDTKYIRFSFRTDEGYNNNWQNTVYFVEGNQPLAEFMPYSQIYTDGTVETVQITGKNLFNKSIEPAQIYVTDTAQRYGYSFPLKAGTYTVSCSADTSNIYCKTYVGGVYGQALLATNTTLTLSEDGYILVYGSSPAIFTDQTNLQLELGSTATTYEPYYNGGTATAEMLLKVGDYKDEQNVTTGGVTRNVGIKVFDGTENWSMGSALPKFSITLPESQGSLTKVPCTNFKGYSGGWVNMPNNSVMLHGTNLGFRCDSITSLEAWKQFLADQYNAGTPVIVVYPTSSPVTEQVAPQPLTVQQGTNIVTITQASIDNLTMELSYKQEV